MVRRAALGGTVLSADLHTKIAALLVQTRVRRGTEAHRTLDATYFEIPGIAKRQRLRHARARTVAHRTLVSSLRR